METQKIPLLKTIQTNLGFRGADDVIKALEGVGCKTDFWLRHMIYNSEVSLSYEEIDLVEVSYEDLGLHEYGFSTIAEIYKRAIERGLGICPSIIGPLLRLQYLDQPRGRVLLIGMDSIPTVDSNHRSIFGIAQHGYDKHFAPVLHMYQGSPTDKWWRPDRHMRWIFMRTR